jgi:hypothetical protein
LITITDNVDAYAVRLKARATTLTQKLVVTINKLTIRMQQRILNRPGSPASASHRRKGWLGNSVRPIPATTDGSMVTGGVQGAGGDAWYGRLFEDGTTRAYEVMARDKKAMMFAMHGEQVLLRKVMHPAFDSSKLAFMSPVLREMEQEITAEIQAATVEAMRG